MQAGAQADGSPEYGRQAGVGLLSTTDSCQTSNREVVGTKDSMASW
jgi:hypothetical protein